MPAVSKSQQRFFGLVKSMQKGDTPKEGEAGKVAKSMSKKDVDDFASTKHKGKPEKVKREQRVKHLIKKMVREKYDSGLSDLFYQQNDMEQAAILAKYGNEGQKKELKKALEKRLSGDVDGFKKSIRNVQTMSATDSDSINTTDNTNVTTGKKSSNLLLPAALVGAGGLGLKTMSDKKKKKEKDMNEESKQDKVMNKLDKAIKFAQENPEKVTAGIAGTALAGLGLSKLMKKKKKKNESIGENSMKKTENTNESSKKEKRNKVLKTAAALAAIGGGGYAADKAGLFEPLKDLYKGYKMKDGKLEPPSPYQELPHKIKADENLTLNVRNLISEQVATNENVRNMLSEKILKKLAKLATLGLAGYGAYKGYQGLPGQDFKSKMSGLGDKIKGLKLKDLNPFKKKAEEGMHDEGEHNDEEKEESNCG